MERYAVLLSRILLAHIFVIAGIGKIGNYAGTQGYMESMGVSGSLLPLVILLELGGGLALILGWKTRWAALALGGFSILAGAIFHHNFADQMQMIMFMKDLAIAGGMLLLAVHGAGELSVDYKLSKRADQHMGTPHLGVR